MARKCVHVSFQKAFAMSAKLFATIGNKTWLVCPFVLVALFAAKKSRHSWTIIDCSEHRWVTLEPMFSLGRTNFVAALPKVPGKLLRWARESYSVYFACRRTEYWRFPACAYPFDALLSSCAACLGRLLNSIQAGASVKGDRILASVRICIQIVDGYPWKPKSRLIRDASSCAWQNILKVVA